MQDFSGLWIPLVTPFHHGEIDHTALQKLVKRLKADGVKGFVACGSTGEAALMDEHEQDAVLDTICATAGDAPVLMGVSGPRPAMVAARMQDLAKRYPLAGYLLPAPSYIRPSQQGLLGYFQAVADASPLPLVVYDIPYRTGVKIELATLLQLAGHPNIQALKDCGGQMQATQALIEDGRLAVLAGEDHNIFSTLALGGAGAIAASAHLETRRFLQLFAALQAQDLPAARQLWQQLGRIIGLSFAEPNPAPLKAVMARLGWMHDELRAPLHSASPALAEHFLEALKQLQD
ncbi:4-hydroxy-tetrahydrodipicolinate synthase [Paucibacter sp. APW11]|uniref:4-hydroxy-tetrahydrodipicolinate synthase n=1 Tax=Roseateles aquae TaxID=3077235 RepID=A0ABU3P9I8_9BURK|nr:4-hydroxy-tetrahydrodipicolinate synthase [Paucibacter sp. APW11]MDT8999249.1 4-hydroxy-tetrahydrodipicolinate synthase [Paucibacter sp. APW11]